MNVSSGVAADGVPGTGPYGAAKAALHGLTRTLSKELGPAGIIRASRDYRAQRAADR